MYMEAPWGLLLISNVAPYPEDEGGPAVIFFLYGLKNMPITGIQDYKLAYKRS